MAGPPHASRAARLRFATLIGITLAVSGGLPPIPAQATAALAAGPAAPAPAPGPSRPGSAISRDREGGQPATRPRLRPARGARSQGPWRSRADLRAIAATERQFDHRLSRIAFGPRLERMAHSLYKLQPEARGTDDKGRRLVVVARGTRVRATIERRQRAGRTRRPDAPPRTRPPSPRRARRAAQSPVARTDGTARRQSTQPQLRSRAICVTVSPWRLAFVTC